MTVVKFPAKQVGPFLSEVLVTGFADSTGAVVLAQPERQVLTVRAWSNQLAGVKEENREDGVTNTMLISHLGKAPIEPSLGKRLASRVTAVPSGGRTAWTNAAES